MGLQLPDIQLTTWSGDPSLRNAHYGASFLFLLYLYDKFGVGFIQELVTQSSNGISAVQETLNQSGNTKRFDDIFSDFVVANYLNDPYLQGGQWGYNLLPDDLPSVRIDESYTSFPVEVDGVVRQYGADYIEIRNEEELISGLKKMTACEQTVLVNVEVEYNEWPKYIKGIAKSTWGKMPLNEKLNLLGKRFSKLFKN